MLLTALAQLRCRYQAVAIVALAVLGVAVLALISTDRASAQQTTIVPDIINNYDAPTLFAVAKADRVELSWTFDADANDPDSWDLAGFRLFRQVTGDVWSGAVISSTIGKDKRSFTHVLSGDLLTKWNNGKRIEYTVKAVYRPENPNVGNLRALGNEDYLFITKAAMNPRSPEWVAQQSTNPLMTLTAHADGVLVSWKWNELLRTPQGWMLRGFGVARMQLDDNNDVVAGSLVFFQPGASRDARSFKDPMTGVPEALRQPGVKVFQYSLYAFYTRLSDGLEEYGKSSHTMFTSPTLPKPTSILAINGGVHWNAPHVAWSSDTGFDKVSHYIVYKNDAHFATVTGKGTSAWGWFTCADSFKVRARYGLFFSKWQTTYSIAGC